MTMQTILMLGSFAVGVIGFACFVLLIALYTAHDRRQRRLYKRMETDKADLTILFQTMRDVIRQQKELARQFNVDLEGKMDAVRQILTQTLEKNKQLYEKQQLLTNEFEEAKAQVAALRQHVALLRSQPATVGTGADAGALELGVPVGRRSGGARDTGTLDAAPDLGVVVPGPRETGAVPGKQEDLPPRRARIEPRPAPESAGPPPGESLSGTGLTHSRFQRWVGADLGDAELREAEEEAGPSSPEDIEAARRAFQALLDRPAQPRGAPLVTAAPVQANGGNGGGALAPLQQRVLEYNAAGMSVAQIARELGIGKGEVRLMLSLARQKRP